MTRAGAWCLKLAGAAAGAALLWPLGNPAVALAGATVGFCLPGRLAAAARRRRARRRRQALAVALPLLARMAAVHRAPYAALAAAAPALPPPLGPGLEQALARHRAGVPLGEALAAMAEEYDGDFYLHQLAGLVAVCQRQGGDLAAALDRLAQRLRQAEELRAEAAAELFGYGALAASLFAFSLAPAVLSAFTGGPQWPYLTGTATGRWLLAWAVWSGLAVAALPAWLAGDG